MQRTRLLAGVLALPLAVAAAIPGIAGTAVASKDLSGTAVMGAGDGGVSGFYRWNDAIPDEPGRMLRTEPLPAELQITGATEQMRILYSSTSGIGSEPTIVSGMLFIPEGEPPESGWPLLAWAHGTTGVADVCAPSWTGPSAAMARYLNGWLDAGFVVVATDYEGLGTPGRHPYLVKRAEAYSVLDSIRAALNARDDIAEDVVIAGQSQGGGAAFASAGLAPEYAPELAIQGTIATGPPYLTADMPTASAVAPEQVDPGLAYVFYAALVARGLNPELQASHLFSQQALPVFERAATTCLGDLMRMVREAELSPINALQPDAITKMAAILLPHYVYPTLTLDQPVFVATGTDDRDVDPRGQLMLVRDACAAGTLVEAHLYAGEDHTGAWLASQGEALAFAQAVRRDAAVSRECAPQPSSP